MAFLYAGVVSWPAVGVGFVGSMFGVWGLGVLFACLLRVEYPLSSRFTCFTLQASQRCAPPPPSWKLEPERGPTLGLMCQSVLVSRCVYSV
eukprot:scaffold132034_cov36-Tisochrysis_lutea.AAC.1